MQFVIFDLDGVLIDSRDAIGNSINFSFGSIGLETPTFREVSSLIGPPLRVGLLALFRERGISDVNLDDLIEIFRRQYSLDAVKMTTIQLGILKVLDSLRHQQTKMFIATSKPAIATDLILSSLNIRDYFAVVQAPNNSEIEEKSETLSKLLGRIGDSDSLNKNTTCLIGDRDHDIFAARDNGIYSIAVTWGYGSIEELEQAGPDQIIESTSRLLSFLRADKLGLQN